MSKRRNRADGAAKGVNEIGDKTEILALADTLLENARTATGIIDDMTREYEDEAALLKARYELRLAPWQEELKETAAALIALMKRSRRVLFDGTDVVDLENGSLIHGKEDKVRIPRDAVDRCEKLGFDEAVKTVKSLDREAVEKWPDERLFLIGAERKPVETFAYDLKNAVSKG